VRRNPQGKGVWNFTTVGSSFAVIDNVTDPPQRWQKKFYDIPGTGRSPQAGGEHDWLELLLGISASRQPQGADARKDLLLFGTRKKGPFATELVMARAPSPRIEHFDEWQFVGTRDAVRSTPAQLGPLAFGLVSEFSVEEMINRGKPIWVLIQSEPMLGRRILVRTAPTAQGPWSLAEPIFSVPEVATNRAYFTYAAKGHASLSRPGELLVTYLVNSQNFGDLMGDTTIYRPKFLRVPTTVLFGR
jgi:hypothetical protein